LRPFGDIPEHFPPHRPGNCKNGRKPTAATRGSKTKRRSHRVGAAPLAWGTRTFESTWWRHRRRVWRGQGSSRT
jgi:hypothetical protein